MSVLGPGTRGVVVATADPREALGRRAALQAQGIPAATLAELGFDTPFPPADPADVAAFWAVATRRPAVAGDAAAGPDGSPADPNDPAGLLAVPAPRRVAVFGGAWTGPDEPDHRAAVRLGAELAGTGIQVVNGGYGGVMDAVSRGAAQAGGVAVGVTIGPWEERVTPNEHLTHQARARDLFARLPLIMDADAWVAFSGGAGTLAEVALCWNVLQYDPSNARPLVVVGERWGRAFDALRELLVVVDPGDHDLLLRAAGVEEALAMVLER